MRSKKIVIFLCAMGALAVLFLFLGTARVTSFGSYVVLQAVSPLTSLVSRMTASVSSMWGVGAEIDRLRDENQRFLAALSGYEDIKKENELLRGQLGVSNGPLLTLFEARVVSFDPLSAASFILIDKGARDGIVEGMPVIRPGNVLVGRVANVYEAFSHVSLLSASGNKVAVTSARHDASGVLAGAAGNLLLLELVQKNAPLAAGDLIVTSGLDAIYPKNLAVGWVTEVQSAEEDIFKRAYVRPAYAGFSHTQIFVITNYLK